MPDISPGSRGRATRPAVSRLAVRRSNGGCTFAESPDRPASEARIIWDAEIDPGTIEATAVTVDEIGPDAIDPASLAPWLSTAIDAAGSEHVVFSDGWHRIRLDISTGTLAGTRPIELHYHLHGVAAAAATILTLRRFLELCRHRRFAASLFPKDRRIARWVDLLRVHDALESGASQREIAAALFGEERVARDWGGASDSLRARVRRLVEAARVMADGRYLTLLRAK